MIWYFKRTNDFISRSNNIWNVLEDLLSNIVEEKKELDRLKDLDQDSVVEYHAANVYKI